MGLTSLEVEWEPSYEGLEFRSSSTFDNFLGRFSGQSLYPQASLGAVVFLPGQLSLSSIRGGGVEPPEITSKGSYGGSKFGSRGGYLP